MAYGHIVDRESRNYQNTRRNMLLLDTRFANQLAMKRGYKILALVAQVQKVCIPLLCF